MATCPFCGETVQEEAKKCTHCGEWLGEAAAAPAQPTVDPAKVKAYRQQIHALGGLDVLIAVLGIGFFAFSLANAREVNPAAGLVALAMALVWGTLGVFLFLKHIWAAIVSLVFYSFYLLLVLFSTALLFLGAASAPGDSSYRLGQMSGALCPIILVLACVFQAWRVIKLDRELRREGFDPRA